MSEEISKYLVMPLSDLESAMLGGYRSNDPVKYLGQDGNSPNDSGRSLLDRTLQAVSAALTANAGAARQKLCVELEYCGNRNHNSVELVTQLADAAFMYAIVLPFPPFTVAVYVIRRGLLDRFCACGN
ncbi:hypothetical protein [Neorhizobium alkalisoli]|uniref:Uncharacterized protein n=1 Tax=Neorhizobium alkalisoli TaxID=528178 RepID=A0A561Q7U2_9HYPH|nr:hypothetical protein [Neorhizobium alkalisoli]TWF46425.1 hypothetical protein FHW37_115122 [Neorhizobium alkalisoli]